MKKYHSLYSKICFGTAAFIIAAQSILCQLSFGNRFSFIINILLAVGAFGIIYRCAIWIYEKCIWKILLNEEYISGKWFHAVKVNYKSKTSSYTEIREGDIVIRQEKGDLSFSAKQKSAGGETSTTWKSIVASIKNDEIILIYEAHRNDNDLEHQKDVQHGGLHKKGVIRLHIVRDEKRNVVSMQGSYTDIFPEYCHGSIILAKSEKNLQELMKEHKYIKK